MARRENGPQPSAGDSPALDALDSLRTESKATIAGRELVFREYAALEGYQVAYEARDFIADLLAENPSSLAGFGPHASCPVAA